MRACATKRSSMTLSVLIAILKQMKVSHGDVEVKLEASNMSPHDVAGIYHEKQGKASIIVISEQS